MLPASAAVAQTVVTACGTDDAAGGVNLRDALATGGAIVLRCPPPHVIRITATRTLRPGTSVDGEGRAILQGAGPSDMFKGTGAVVIRRMTMRNHRTGRGRPSGILSGGRIDLRLEQVRITDTRYPLDVANLVAYESHFERNGPDTAPTRPGSVVLATPIIRATDVQLLRSTFTRNRGLILDYLPHVSNRPVSSLRRLLIEDSTFSGNGKLFRVNDALVTIRRSTFQDNGHGQQRGSAACCNGSMVLLHSIAEITGSRFAGNHGGHQGGAIQAQGSRLRVVDSQLAGNRGGTGAGMLFWGHPARARTWIGDDQPGAIALSLERVSFTDNRAESAGGGLAFAGQADLRKVEFSGNQARHGGAVAAWNADSSPPAQAGTAIRQLVNTSIAVPDRLQVARGWFIANQATQRGGAIDSADAVARLGNALVARNTSGAPGTPTAAVSGQRIELVASTVVGNNAVGISPGGGNVVRLRSSIVAGNAPSNCTGQILADAHSLQWPSSACGSAPARDPLLDTAHVPSLNSPARRSGDLPTCNGHPLVGGIDLRGRPRGGDGACSSGAFEADMVEDLREQLGLQPRHGDSTWHWLRYLLMLAFLLGLLLAWLCCRRRRRRKAR